MVSGACLGRGPEMVGSGVTRIDCWKTIWTGLLAEFGGTLLLLLVARGCLEKGLVFGLAHGGRFDCVFQVVVAEIQRSWLADPS